MSNRSELDDSHSPQGPMQKHVLPDLLCVSHLRWDFVFQRPQHLMTRWAKHARVFYVEEPIEHDGDQPRLEVRPYNEQLTVAAPRIPGGSSPESARRWQA